jgi:phenylacetic acid degradation operon negative regulatory protein
MQIPTPPLRHQQLILTIFGLYGRRGGSALPVSVLIEMLGDLGHDPPGVRSAVSRLKAKGVLNSVRSGGAARYELSPRSVEMVREGDERIFNPHPDDSDDRWVLAIFSVPESMRERRHQLRAELARLGFGSMSAGVGIAPAAVREGARRRLTERGLAEYVEFFTGDYSEESNMRDKVAQWWDLEALAGQIDEFMDYYGGALAAWTARVGEDPAAALAASGPEAKRDAFRYYVPMLTLWRRLPYRDPGLPLKYLPNGWRGPEARDVFFGIHRLIGPLAEAHALSLVESSAAA